MAIVFGHVQEEIVDVVAHVLTRGGGVVLDLVFPLVRVQLDFESNRKTKINFESRMKKRKEMLD